MPSVLSTEAVAAAESSSSGSSPKWLTTAAAAVGGALVIAGVAYYIFWGGGSSNKRDKKPKGSKQVKGKTVVSDKPCEEVVTIDDVPEDEMDGDPLTRALAHKNKGNKYFRGGRYELAIKSYTEAILVCPKEKATDLSTFYQNRAAAHEKLESMHLVLSDCNSAIELNKGYSKALERRARVCRRLANMEDPSSKKSPVEYLKTALEDLTAVCILEGFQKQENIVLVDTVLKELGFLEAKEAVKNRKPILTSAHFVQQYFQSFDEDPIMRDLAKEAEGDVDEKERIDEAGDNVVSGFRRAKQLLRTHKYEGIVDACTEEIKAGGEFFHEAKVLRGTFYILSKQQPLAFADLTSVIEDDTAKSKLRVNALIKRASLYIQQCKDRQKDPELSFADFGKAEDIDPDNADIYHHRGQVYLLTDEVDKALADFTRSVELNPGFPIAYVQKLYTEYRKAVISTDRERVNNTINLFEEALEKFPKCVETYALFAQVLSDQEKFERADRLYQRAQGVDPSNANLLVHRALVTLQWRGDVETAVTLIKSALEMDDRCEFAYETLGTIEVQRGELARALELFEKALPLANTELEMAHLFGLRNAAVAQMRVSQQLGVKLPAMA